MGRFAACEDKSLCLLPMLARSHDLDCLASVACELIITSISTAYDIRRNTQRNAEETFNSGVLTS